MSTSDGAIIPVVSLRFEEWLSRSVMYPRDAKEFTIPEKAKKK
jgi:hypothetical protein